MTSQLDEWLSIAQECKYLPEPDLRKLCDYVCAALHTRKRRRHAGLSLITPAC